MPSPSRRRFPHLADSPVLAASDSKQRATDFRLLFGEDFIALDDERFGQLRRADGARAS